MALQIIAVVFVVLLLVAITAQRIILCIRNTRLF